MSKRIDTETGIKHASSSRERNNIRFLQRVKIFAKKFGLSTEQADQFSFTG